MNARTSARREDIDALRVGATYLLFVFHGAMVFNPAPFYHIRNAELSLAMLIVCGFIGLWHMPVFFLLAGWATHASVTLRGRAGYLRERIAKLFIPLVAGVILFGPIIKFLELRSGYLGIPLLGRTTYWLRVGAEEHLCRVMQTNTMAVQESHP